MAQLRKNRRLRSRDSKGLAAEPLARARCEAPPAPDSPPEWCDFRTRMVLVFFVGLGSGAGSASTAPTSSFRSASASSSIVPLSLPKERLGKEEALRSEPTTEAGSYPLHLLFSARGPFPAPRPQQVTPSLYLPIQNKHHRKQAKQVSKQSKKSLLPTGTTRTRRDQINNIRQGRTEASSISFLTTAKHVTGNHAQCTRG